MENDYFATDYEYFRTEYRYFVEISQMTSGKKKVAIEIICNL